MRVTVPLLAALIGIAPMLPAQRQPTRSVTLAAGPMSFDASGTGTATVVALSGVQTLPWRWVAFEAQAAYAGLAEQALGPATRMGILEGQAQLQWPSGRLKPYLGLGGGLVRYLANANGRRATEPAVGGAIGMRAAMTDAWGLRLDARLRGWQFAGATDGAVNSSAELTLGLSRRF